MTHADAVRVVIGLLFALLLGGAFGYLFGQYCGFMRGICHAYDSVDYFDALTRAMERRRTSGHDEANSASREAEGDERADG